MIERSRRLILLPIFFVSGTAGLIYEVVWTRFLVLFLGNTAHAHAVVLATFMGGLAVGYAWLGRAADRASSRPDGARRLLALYALLEGLVGLYGLLFPALMAVVSAAFLGASRALGPDSAALVPLSLAASASVLAIPSVLMGGTLPVLVTWAAGRPDEAGAEASRFYAVNSAGAVVGAVLTGFVLIEHYGQRGTVYVAAALNLILALASLALSRGSIAAATPVVERPPPERIEKNEKKKAKRAKKIVESPPWIPHAVAFACGLAALVLEVVWIRLYTLIYGSSTQSFTVIVAAFIAGLTIGAALARRVLGRGARIMRVIALAAAASALLVWATQPAYSWLPWLFGRMRMSFGEHGHFVAFQLFKFGLSFVMMLIPTVGSGLLLPLAAQLAARTEGRVGSDVGRVFAWNTLGSVVGAAFTGTVIIPHLGLRGALLGAIAVYFAIAIGAAFVDGRQRGSRALVIALAGSAALVPLFESALAWDEVVLNTGEFRRNSPIPPYDEWVRHERRARLLYYEEGATTTVAVQELPDGARFLKVNGKTDASKSDDVLTQAGLAAVGALAADNLDRALVIGFGSGVTANALLKFGATVDLVEIEPAVLRAAPQFKEVNDNCLDDPHLHAHIADARNYLLATDTRYDLVVSEPSNPWVAGVGSLFTREFFEAVRARLTDGGAFVQWFHTYDMDDEMVRLIVRTLAAVYSDVTVWEFDSDVALVARTRPIQHDVTRLEQHFAQPRALSFFARVGVYDLFSLLSLQLASESGLRALVDEGPLHVDDLPLLEYRAPRAQFARSHSSFLADHDQRASLEPGSGLLYLDYTAQRKVTLDEMIDFTLLQVNEKNAPPSFRFTFLDTVLKQSKEPATLGHLVVGAEKTHRTAESDQALAALVKLDPDNARSIDLAVETMISRLGPRAALAQPALPALLRRCVKAPGSDVFRSACRRHAAELDITLE